MLIAYAVYNPGWMVLYHKVNIIVKPCVKKVCYTYMCVFIKPYWMYLLTIMLFFVAVNKLFYTTLFYFVNLLHDLIKKLHLHLNLQTIKSVLYNI